MVSGLQTSSTCHRVVSQMSPRCLPDVVSQILSPSCQQSFSTCCLVVVHLSRNRGWSPHCLPVVSPLSPACFPDAVSELSPNFISQFPAVSQNLSYHCLPYCFQIPAICHPMLSSDVFRCCLLYLSPVASRLSCRRGLPIVSLSLEFGTVTAVDLQRWVNLERQPIPSPQF